MPRFAVLVLVLVAVVGAAGCGGAESGSLVIAQEASSAGGAAFSFTGDLGEFTLTDPSALSQSFSGLEAGTYVITQGSPAGWWLRAVTCDAATWTRDGQSLTVDLAGGEQVRCTFTSEVDEDIATVGDVVIRLSDVQSLYEVNQPVDDAFRRALFIRVALAAVDQALAAEYGTAVDPAAVETYYTQFQDLLAAQGATPAELLQVENASLRMIYLNAEISAARDAAMEALVADPDIIEALFAEPANVTTVCAKHILVATQEEADEVFARLRAGEDFAAVAAEVSIDTQAAGGDLGCNIAGDYVEPFAEAALAAPLGEVYGPFETDFGFHVVVVAERTAATRAEYDADPWEVLSSAQAGKIWEDWITAIVAAADVWVAEAYGTWTGSDLLAPGEEVPTTTAGG